MYRNGKEINAEGKSIAEWIWEEIEAFPLENVEMIELGHNYRSHQTILDTSHSLISQSNNHSNEIPLQAFFDHGGIMQYRQFQNYKTNQ